MPVVARVYVVRHGETDANRAHIIQGQLDTSLNIMGLEQAQLVSEVLRDIAFDFAYTSDLKRASAVSSNQVRGRLSAEIETRLQMRYLLIIPMSLSKDRRNFVRG